MATSFIKDNFIAQFDKLPVELQMRALDFIKSLVPHGVKGKELLRYEGIIPADDLRLMTKAIEENCEQVDIGEW